MDWSQLDFQDVLGGGSLGTLLTVGGSTAWRGLAGWRQRRRHMPAIDRLRERDERSEEPPGSLDELNRQQYDLIRRAAADGYLEVQSGDRQGGKPEWSVSAELTDKGHEAWRRVNKPLKMKARELRRHLTPEPWRRRNKLFAWSKTRPEHEERRELRGESW